MTNYEHYKEQIDKITRLGWRIAIDKDGEPHACSEINCNDCLSDGSDCYKIVSEWADKEYIEPEKQVDWSKVPVDTPILVSDDNRRWEHKHFAKYENGYVYAWANGMTSFTVIDFHSCTWKYAKLAEVEL